MKSLWQLINGELGALANSVKNVHHLNWTDQHLESIMHICPQQVKEEQRKMELDQVVGRLVAH